MKFKSSYVRKELVPTNQDMMERALKDPKAVMAYYPILRLLAAIADGAITDGDWANFGMPKTRDAILLTIHAGTALKYAGGADLAELAVQAQAVLNELQGS